MQQSRWRRSAAFRFRRRFPFVLSDTRAYRLVSAFREESGSWGTAAVGLLRMTKWTRFVFLTFVCVACLARGQNKQPLEAPQPAVWAPLQLPGFEEEAKSVKPNELVSALQINHQHISLEQTTLAELGKQYRAEIGHQGDASEFLQWVCLTGMTDGQRWVLWLESGEIHGGNLGGFQLRRIGGQVKLDTRCRTINAPASISTMPNMLTVGMRERDVVKVLGTPTARKPNFLYFEHHRKIVIRGEPYDIVNTVTLVLRDGVVWAFEVWKTTSS
jgi:hypothetical protein